MPLTTQMDTVEKLKKNALNGDKDAVKAAAFAQVSEKVFHEKLQVI